MYSLDSKPFSLAMKLWICFLFGLGTLVLSASLHATQVFTEPSGARIRLIDAEDREPREGLVYTSPAEIRFRRSRDPYTIEVSLPGYQSERRVVEGDRDEVVRVVLAPLQTTRNIEFRGSPRGGRLALIDGISSQSTRIPGELTLLFSRTSKNAPWRAREARFSEDGYESQTVTIPYEASSPFTLPDLARIRDERRYMIVAETEDGAPLEANVQVDGEVRGKTPLEITLPFRRDDGQDDWNTHEVLVEIPNDFVPVTRVITYDSDTDQRVELVPVTEVPVVPYFPITRQTPRGPRPGWDMEPRLGVLDTRDLMSPAIDLRPISKFTRENFSLQALNSFALTPDGQSVVYAVTMQTQDGNYYSNIFIKDANDQSLAFSQLTRGTLAIDTSPAMAWEEGSNLVVFQSNRSDPEGWDISSFRLRDNRLFGGIQQLTRENRFNYGPALASEQLPIYFISQHRYPRAEPLISFVRADGTGTTNLMETGSMLNVTQHDKVYLVREAPDNGKLRIYSISPEGQQFSTVINDFAFNSANNFSPRLSPDGNQLLFVSDYAEDEQGRANNNIFLLDLRTERIQQITDNGSDDIHPRWSPTEPGVIYFMSSRGGAYNIWRLRLAPGS